MPAHKVLVLDWGPKAGAAVHIRAVLTREVFSKLSTGRTADIDDDEKDRPHGLGNKSIVALLRAVESTARPTKGDIALWVARLVLKNEGSSRARISSQQPPSAAAEIARLGSLEVSLGVAR